MKRVLVTRNRYFDSVFLMRTSFRIEQLDGIRKATVAMGTPANLESLEAAGFALRAPDGAPILPNDLIVALEGEPEALRAVEETLETQLRSSQAGEAAATSSSISLAEALEMHPETNLALISVPGRYAAYEARRALRAGLHVMLFSDNVPVDEEIALKREAIGRGLLMMGPDCGTAILNGAPLGFANVCRSGSIGIVGASGTGIQEISSLVHQLGGGISQAVGTGGRDLSPDVGALMTTFGIDALGDDPRTAVVVVVSKAPSTALIHTVLDRLDAVGKPAVIHFVGWEPTALERGRGRLRFAATLEDAAVLACRAADIPTPPEWPDRPFAEAPPHLASRSGRIVGLFCGGTLCQEAWSLLERAGAETFSNVAVDPARKIHPEAAAAGHLLWDLGDDVFTVGVPHPMIEPALRDDRVRACGTDSSIAVVLGDCVIGYGAHPDPASSLAAAARFAMTTAEQEGRALRVIASVTGTDLDPQVASAQRETLRQAGVIVARSNAAAARTALAAAEGGGTR